MDSPLGLGETTDVSNVCIHFLFSAGRWVTGPNLIADGGYAARLYKYLALQIEF